jgi:chemotaxis protein CheD
VTITVNVSDVRTSKQLDDIIVTHSLGSCVGVCLYDPVANVAGMLHYQLPSASIDASKAAERPAMYADTGMELLMKEMFAQGAQKQRLKVIVAGGASMMDDLASSSIGRRNQAAIRKIIFQQGLFIHTQDLGGTMPRTVYLNVSTGEVTIKSGGTVKAA